MKYFTQQLLQAQPNFPANIPSQPAPMAHPTLIQAVPQASIQQQIDQSQLIHQQPHALPTHATIQGQWIVPSYAQIPGQNIIQLQPIQHVHYIQSQATLQHMMPYQMAPQAQLQTQQTLSESTDTSDQYNLQLKFPEHKQQDASSEYNISRRTSSDCQMLSSENENSSHDITPEHTFIESMDNAIYHQQFMRDHHRKLSQQNSLEKAEAGPQTIADLQQKLTQLTSQPSESINYNTPPISHPSTPHTQHAPGVYDMHMNQLQQKMGAAPGIAATTLVGIPSLTSTLMKMFNGCIIIYRLLHPRIQRYTLGTPFSQMILLE